MSSRGGHNARGRGGAASSGPSKPVEKPKKENILDLSKYQDKAVKVKFNGGREVEGTLKGWDQLMNLVLDEGKEILHGKSCPFTSNANAFRGVLRLSGD